ncbi:MAG: hypothetical protein JO360_03725 [Acidobacteria bacterium]|nr:hypothetical protein [Acidobacteriota bacterium]
MLSPNTVLQSRYRVTRQLGEGEMGAVYEATDERVSCVVAIKETLTALDEEGRRAFELRRGAYESAATNLRSAARSRATPDYIENCGLHLVAVAMKR